LVLTSVLLLQLGATPMPGRVPAPRFDSLVQAAMRDGAFPGAALAIGTADSILYLHGYGRLTWSARSPAVSAESTLYDLASLTKVIATTTAAMLLVDRGAMAIDAPVARYVPEFNGPGTAPITVRQLLTHTSGLRADLAIGTIRGAPDAAALLRLVYRETPRVPPGTRVVYSDVNAVLLGEIVRRASGASLDGFTAREITGPLALTETRFRPRRDLLSRTAPTGLWHGHAVAGVVNDPTGAKLGGVAGNAGLFSSARDVATFAQFMLRDGRTPDGRVLVRPETVRAFTTRAVYFGGATEGRALGWQTLPTGERVSSAGSRFGARSFGHTGWTGTSLWIDPDRGVFVVLLTNRVFSPRTRQSFALLKRLRGALADAVAAALDDRRF
jgi:CubicO group peptidase (beta-lactamase class C family)